MIVPFYSSLWLNITCIPQLTGPQEWIDLLLAEPRLLDALQFLCSYTGAAQWADPTAGARKAVAKVFLTVLFLLVELKGVKQIFARSSFSFKLTYL